jgi:amino acid adenylation domain-containing protein
VQSPSKNSDPFGSVGQRAPNPGVAEQIPPAAIGNFASALLRTAAICPERCAVQDGEDLTDFAAFARRARTIATALTQAGVGPGERVGLYLRRDAGAAAAFFGVLAAGAVAVVINETLRPRQIAYIVAHVDARVVITSESLLKRLGRPLEVAARLLDVDDLLNGDPPAEESLPVVARVDADVAQIIFTSGSTGLPKGVTLSHGNLWAGARSVVAYLGIRADDKLASLLPFSFDYGLNQLLCCVATGATLVIERSVVPQRIVQALRKAQVTVLAAVPPLWLQLLGVDDFVARPLPALRIMTNTGGHLPKEAVRQLRHAQPHAELVLMYGLTEAFRSCFLAPDRVDRKPGSVGGAIPGAEVLLLNEQLQPCAPGETGQLVHRGPTVAMGYWNDPEATARRFRPNPLLPPGAPEVERVVFSGDYMYRDEEGDLYFVGRQDTLIKTLGYRVSPDEVVDAMYASGEILEAVVTSEPDPERGSRIIAYVVLREGGQLDRLQSHAARELPRYMQPSRIEARPSLPRTASGKHDARAAHGVADDS